MCKDIENMLKSNKRSPNSTPENVGKEDEKLKAEKKMLRFKIWTYIAARQLQIHYRTYLYLSGYIYFIMNQHFYYPATCFLYEPTLLLSGY